MLQVLQEQQQCVHGRSFSLLLQLQALPGPCPSCCRVFGGGLRLSGPPLQQLLPACPKPSPLLALPDLLLLQRRQQLPLLLLLTSLAA